MAESSDAALPAPRRVLAALIAAIAAIPVSDAASTGRRDGDGSTGTSNALQRIPEDSRPLVATLHVLFPALLLPALDLLDRGRIVRWGAATVLSLSTSPPSSPSTSSSTPPSPPLYQVIGGGDRPHVVHLRAWHCTCAFFALRAAAAAALPDTEHGVADDGDDDDIGDGALPQLPLAFSTPPCKHLLACLLAEVWPAALGGYVVRGRDDGGDEDGNVAPETLAGLVAGVL